MVEGEKTYNAENLNDMKSKNVKIVEGENLEFKSSFDAAVMFREAGIIEKYGSGIRRVRQILNDAGAKEPIFEVLPGFFKVTLFPIAGQKEGRNVTKDVTEDVTENVTRASPQKRKILILEKIKENSLISVDRLAEILCVSRRTVLRDMDRLKVDGRIKRIGPDKGGYWELLGKAEMGKVDPSLPRLASSR